MENQFEYKPNQDQSFRDEDRAIQRQGLGLGPINVQGPRGLGNPGQAPQRQPQQQVDPVAQKQALEQLVQDPNTNPKIAEGALMALRGEISIEEFNAGVEQLAQTPDDGLGQLSQY